MACSIEAPQGRVEWCLERAKRVEGHHLLVYILRCADETFYVGHTEDLDSREALHNAGTAADYTASRRPVVLVYSERFDTLEEAVAREKQLKRWSGRKKAALIAADATTLKELSRRRGK